MELTRKQIAAFGIGAIGKDMVYALSANYVMYYYQDLLGLNAGFVGLILMIARVFDAFNDPLMGVLVAKTRTKWGRFRPWLLSGTVLNALVLYAMYAVPEGIRTAQGSLMIWFPVIYILWGVTYTMMDIPYWSMIPALADDGKGREKLSVIGRTCAGIGSAVIQVGTMAMVGILGGTQSIPESATGTDLAALQAANKSAEVSGFALVGLIVAVVFIVAEIICCLFVKERSETRMQTATVKEMFRSLLHNDQAMVVVVAILLINSALYITSNFVIYFFKYDMGDIKFEAYTVFSAVGGLSQIIGMMAVYPILRKSLSNTKIFSVALLTSMSGYAILLAECFAGLGGSLPALLVPCIMIFAANGILTVLTTVFLTGTVDYAELKTGHREESVIFSMQTFVVKAASGLSVFLVGLGLNAIGMGDVSGKSQDELAADTSFLFTDPMRLGLRLMMTVVPIVGLAVAFFYFRKKFTLTDERAAEIAEELRSVRAKQ